MSGHDPITYKMYVKQLAKIKTRKNQYLPKETEEKKMIHGGDWKIKKDPFVQKYHENQLGKIKTRKNVYIQNETDLKKQKEIKDITEKINKLEREIKENDKLTEKKKKKILNKKIYCFKNLNKLNPKNNPIKNLKTIFKKFLF